MTSGESYQSWRAGTAEPDDYCAVPTQEGKTALVCGSVAFGVVVTMIITLIVLTSGGKGK